MARQVRVEFPGAIYHVMARGDRREPIVLDDGDRTGFLRAVGEMCDRGGALVHAYALLDNHYHLIVETPGGNLVEGMRWLQNTYTRRFNNRHGLWGHVFGGRYKSVLIGEDGDFFLRAVDYVHLNPVRAGLSGLETGLERYRWCSLADYCQSPGRRAAWLVTGRALDACGLKDGARGRERFLLRLEQRVREEGAGRAGLVDAGLGPGLSLQSTIRRGWYFGSAAFRERMLGLLDRGGGGGRRRACDGYHGWQAGDHGEARAKRIVDVSCRSLGIGPGELGALKGNDPRKALIAELIRSETTVRLDWVGEQLGMGSRSNCSHLIRRQRERLAGDVGLMRAREKLLRQVNSQ